MEMPIKFKSGASIGPVALVCGLIAFLGLLGLFLALVLYANTDRVEFFVKPFAPVFSVIVAGSLLWLKLHLNLKTTTGQNEEIATTVNQRLNGELDARIKAATAEAVKEIVSPAPSVVPAHAADTISSAEPTQEVV